MEYGGGRGETAPSSYLLGAGLQLFRQLLVRAGGRERAVPHGPLAVTRPRPSRQLVGECPVGERALPRRSVGVHRGAYEWMPEAQQGARHLQMPCRLRGVQGLPVGLQPPGRAEHGGSVSAVVRGCDQQ